MNSKERQTPLKFVWKIIEPYKWWYLVMFQAPIVSAFYPVMYNYAIKLLIDLFTEHQVVTQQLAFLPVLYFALAHVIQDVAWRLSNYASWVTQPYVRKEIITRSYDYIADHSYTFFQNNMAGAIVSKIKGISDNYHIIWTGFKNSLTNPVAYMIVSATCVYLMNVNIFLVVIAFSIIYVPCCVFLFGRLGRIQTKCTNEYHKAIGLVADNITNIFTIFNFATKKKEHNKLEEYYYNYNIPLQKSWFKLDFWTGVILSLLYWSLMISIFIYTIHLKNTNPQITAGDVAFIISMSCVLTENIWYTSISLKDFINACSDFKSSFSILELPHEVIDKPNPKNLKITNGEIIFKNVCFSYENERKIFENFTLHIKAGEKIGIVGYSGAGKSTLISLLLKNFSIKSGDIIIDNQSIYDVSSDSLRSQISLIPQDIMLFHRSIAENIGYAKPNATQFEIENAAKMANIHDFIVGLPQGYNTLVGERGIKTSGGQRQRMAIARAILKNAPILILDEATSSLDSNTEHEVQKSINAMLNKDSNGNVCNNATTITIAHRLSTIKHMDRIIVTEKGSIVEDGPFNELIAKPKGKFKELWDGQINGMIA